MFVWWWVKLRNATDFYKATSVLMIGLSIQYMSLMTCTIRAYFFNEDYDIIVSAWYIAPSKYIIAVSLFWYTYYVSKRIFFGNGLSRTISNNRKYNPLNCPHKDVCNMFETCMKDIN